MVDQEAEEVLPGLPKGPPEKQVRESRVVKLDPSWYLHQDADFVKDLCLKVRTTSDQETSQQSFMEPPLKSKESPKRFFPKEMVLASIYLSYLKPAPREVIFKISRANVQKLASPEPKAPKAPRTHDEGSSNSVESSEDSSSLGDQNSSENSIDTDSLEVSKKSSNTASATKEALL